MQNNLQNTRKISAPILVLTILSLAFSLISCINYVGYYSGYGGAYEWFFSFSALDMVDMVGLFKRISPWVLLTVYVLGFYKRGTGAALLPVTFGLLAATPIFSFLLSYFFDDYFIIENYLFDIILDVLTVSAFTLGVIATCTKSPKKVLLILAVALGFAVTIASRYNFFEWIPWYWEDGFYVSIISWILKLLGDFAGYTALLLIGLRPQQAPVTIMTPEESLRFIKEKFDLGLISQEEYAAHRKAILERL